MATIKKVVDLEIEQDLKFQERMWRIQRIGWIFMTFLVLLTILGLFGDGLLTNAQAGSWDPGAVIDYPRFARNQSQFSFVIHISPDVIADNKVRLEINDEYLDNFYVEKIVPEPSSEATTSQGKVFEFDVSGDPSLPDITFFLRPINAGFVQALFTLAEGRTINFRQFIYP